MAALASFQIEKKPNGSVHPIRVRDSAMHACGASAHGTRPYDADDLVYRKRDATATADDFSRMRVQPARDRSGSVRINGVAAVGSLDDADEVFVGGDPAVPTPAPAPRVPIPNPPPPPMPEEKKAPAGCPTDIKVAGTGNLQMDESFAKAGWLTGWGGFAQMEVSDPGGKKWDGVQVHENLKNVKNTCGEEGACSNAQGEGGAKGSTFKIGKESGFLGLFKLPAKLNNFYDLHVIGLKGVSLLHKIGKPTCEIQCQQYYDCAGKQIGPTFNVTYSLKQDLIKSGGTSYNVTRAEMKKEATK